MYQTLQTNDATHRPLCASAFPATDPVISEARVHFALVATEYAKVRLSTLFRSVLQLIAQRVTMGTFRSERTDRERFDLLRVTTVDKRIGRGIKHIEVAIFPRIP
jgi:hypothetical protein